MKHLNIYPDLEQLNRALAEWISNDIKETLFNVDRYTIALSGGSTPKALYDLLAAEYLTAIDWNKVHVFFDDERYVPFDDENNNARMVYEHLISKVDIPANQVLVMRTDIAPGDAASEYENTLKQYFKDAPQTFNLVLLGMGDDGHTLSLFPGTHVVHETEKWVSEVLLNDSGKYRITLTTSVVNLASKVVFLVAGEGKATTLNKVLNEPLQPDKYPSQLIKPASDNLYWFVDEAAAGKLTSKTEV